MGYGNIIMANKINAIVSPESSPIKRLIAECKDSGRLVDATYGRRTRSVILLDNGSAVLSSLLPETIAARIDKDLARITESDDSGVDNE